MFRPLARVVFALSLALLALPLGGCKTSLVRIEIPGFGAGSIDGIWFWRWSDELGSFQRTCRVELAKPQLAGVEERVEYTQLCDQPGTVSFLLSSAIERSPSEPAKVVLELYYMRWEEDQGIFRASVYNASGESALSETEIVL